MGTMIAHHAKDFTEPATKFSALQSKLLTFISELTQVNNKVFDNLVNWHIQILQNYIPCTRNGLILYLKNDDCTYLKHD